MHTILEYTALYPRLEIMNKRHNRFAYNIDTASIEAKGEDIKSRNKKEETNLHFTVSFVTLVS